MRKFNGELCLLIFNSKAVRTQEAGHSKVPVHTSVSADNKTFQDLKVGYLMHKRLTLLKKVYY
jgi:hypothetical protein